MSTFTETDQSGGGISRRVALRRSAAGVGIALTGNYSGLFGPGAAPAQAKGDPAAAATGEAGYGPLVDDPAGLLTAVTTNAE
jgi:hypothetical protein